MTLLRYTITIKVDGKEVYKNSIYGGNAYRKLCQLETNIMRYLEGGEAKLPPSLKLIYWNKIIRGGKANEILTEIIFEEEERIKILKKMRGKETYENNQYF